MLELICSATKKLKPTDPEVCIVGCIGKEFPSSGFQVLSRIRSRCKLNPVLEQMLCQNCDD